MNKAKKIYFVMILKEKSNLAIMEVLNQSKIILIYLFFIILSYIFYWRLLKLWGSVDKNFIHFEFWKEQTKIIKS